MDSLFSVQSEVLKVESKARGVARILFETQENLTLDARARIMKWHNEQPGWLTFFQEKVDPEYIANLPKLTFDKNEKSPAERLRAVMFVYWEQNKPTDDFEVYYRSQVEKLIGAYKEKLA